MRDRSADGADAPAEQSPPARSVLLEPDAEVSGLAARTTDSPAAARPAASHQAAARPAAGYPAGSHPARPAAPYPAEPVPADAEVAGNRFAGPHASGTDPDSTDPDSTDPDSTDAGRPGAVRRTAGRRWAALAWVAGAAALFVLFLRITRTRGVNSDASNNALQAFDMLHGHLMLHGWIIGDATYYTFELPLIAVVEVFFGAHDITMNVAEALIYLIVCAWAIAIAVAGSSGLARAARAAVVVAVLAAPALIASDMWIPLGIPDHTGTSVFLLIPCLLIDRKPDRWWTAPLIAVLLAAGEIGDVTVRYVAVPAIALACGYRVLKSRRRRSWDTTCLTAAVLSVPLALAVRATMLHTGFYQMVSPQSALSPVTSWWSNIAVSWGTIRELYGAQPGPTAPPAGTVVIFGYACLFIALAGLVRVLWHWRTARRAEHALVLAIAANLAVYFVSTLPSPASPHDIFAILPCGAILGARALVPDRIGGRIGLRIAALAGTGFALAAALLPLSVAAAQPYAAPVVDPLAQWLAAHGLRYGIGGYWDGSAVTLETGGEVAVRPVRTFSEGHPVQVGHMVSGTYSTAVGYYVWETDTFWFDPARHYANFVVVNVNSDDLISLAVTRSFGKPVRTHVIGVWDVLIYNHNLLDDLSQPPPRPIS